MSPLDIIRYPDAEALARSVGARLVAAIVERQASGIPVSLVLTGGRIGTASLAAATAGDADWSMVDLWWGDERYLPADDAERNEMSAREALLDRVRVDPARVHPMPPRRPGLSPEQAAEQYAGVVTALTATRAAVGLPLFDIVMLGIGEDGHVASLFPELPAVHAAEATVVAVHGAPKPPPTRLTMTLPLLRSAEEVWLMASGASKADAVRLMLEPGAGPLQVPAAAARGRERTLLLVDEDAAWRLPPDLGRRAG